MLNSTHHHMNRRSKSSWISLLLACHLVLLAVVGTIMNTSLAIHDVSSDSQESTTSHHHHLAITHFDHGNSEVTHHHNIENFQPVGLVTIPESFSKPHSHLAFSDSVGPHLLYIHPDGLLRPPRSLL